MRMKASKLLAAAQAMPKALAHPVGVTALHPFESAKVTAMGQHPFAKANPNPSPLQQFAPQATNPGPTALQRPEPDAAVLNLPADKGR